MFQSSLGGATMQSVTTDVMQALASVTLLVGTLVIWARLLDVL